MQNLKYAPQESFLQFIPVPGHEATGHELRDALRGVRRLDGTKEEVHIINMSLAGLDETEEERDILKELSSNKILIAGAGMKKLTK